MAHYDAVSKGGGDHHINLCSDALNSKEDYVGFPISVLTLRFNPLIQADYNLDRNLFTARIDFTQQPGSVTPIQIRPSPVHRLL